MFGEKRDDDEDKGKEKEVEVNEEEDKGKEEKLNKRGSDELYRELGSGADILLSPHRGKEEAGEKGLYSSDGEKEETEEEEESEDEENRLTYFTLFINYLLAYPKNLRSWKSLAKDIVEILLLATIGVSSVLLSAEALWTTLLLFGANTVFSYIVDTDGLGTYPKKLNNAIKALRQKREALGLARLLRPFTFPIVGYLSYVTSVAFGALFLVGNIFSQIYDAPATPTHILVVLAAVLPAIARKIIIGFLKHCAGIAEKACDERKIPYTEIAKMQHALTAARQEIETLRSANAILQRSQIAEEEKDETQVPRETPLTIVRRRQAHLKNEEGSSQAESAAQVERNKFLQAGEDEQRILVAGDSASENEKEEGLSIVRETPTTGATSSARFFKESSGADFSQQQITGFPAASAREDEVGQTNQSAPGENQDDGKQSDLAKPLDRKNN